MSRPVNSRLRNAEEGLERLKTALVEVDAAKATAFSPPVNVRLAHVGVVICELLLEYEAERAAALNEEAKP